MVVHGFVFAYFGTTQFSCCIVWYCMVLYYSLHYCMVLHCCLRRAGCISQDTFLLYLISLQLSSLRISLNEIDANNSFPSCAQLSDGRVSSCGHQPHPPRPNMKLLCKTFQYVFKYDTSWCSGRICAPCLNSRSGINLPPPSHSSRPQQFLSAVKNICRPATHNREKKIIKKCQNMFYFANEFRHVKSAFNVIELLCHVIWADKSKLLLLSLLPMTMK